MRELEAAVAEQWQLQNDIVCEMSDDVREKTAQKLVDDGWTAIVMRLSVDRSQRDGFNPEYFVWAARVGKFTCEDVVGPCLITRPDGDISHGVAVWRLPKERDSASDE